MKTIKGVEHLPYELASYAGCKRAMGHQVRANLTAKAG